MTKYIIPSVSVSAFLSSYFGAGFWNKEKKISSLAEAVKNLNENNESEEAIEFILSSEIEAARMHLHRLNSRSLGALASHGWPLVQSVPVDSFILDEDDLCFESLLEKFDLGEDFRAALAWLNRVPCTEDELGCTDAWFGRRPSQTSRLQRILQALFIKTENSGSKNIDEAIVQFLYAMYTTYKEDNRAIMLLSLKTLANVALLSAQHASKILRSEWLRLLAKEVLNAPTLEERMLVHKVFRNILYSLGMNDYFLQSDVYELHLSLATPVMDIVLIHGLRGSVAYTWRQKDSFNKTITECWPKDWIPHDVTEPIRIIGVDYPSYLVQFTGTMESLQKRADRFAEQLNNAGVGKRPVVFICHSMGGLLAKKLILDNPQLRANTVGVLFIATPHKGSPIAAWGYDVLSVSEDVRFLRESNVTNQQLDRDFGVIHDSIPIISSMVETRESNLIGRTKGIIVPCDSAVYSRGSLYHIDEVHHNVCKPSERGSPSYGVVLNFLRDSILEAKKKQSS